MKNKNNIFKYLLLTLAVIVMIFCLVSCSEKNNDSNDGENGSEDGVKNSEDIEFSFRSNGDGTCVIDGMNVNVDDTAGLRVEFPEKSPEGETVVEIGGLRMVGSRSVPKMLLEEDFEEILEIIEKDISESTSFYLGRFKSYYLFVDPEYSSINDSLREQIIRDYPVCEVEPVYVFDYSAAQAEVLVIMELLEKTSYTPDMAMEDYNALIDKVKGSGKSNEEIQKIISTIPRPTAVKKNIVSVVLPSGLKSIGSSAFSNWQALKEIEIPNGVTNIGRSAFSGCVELTSIKLPDSVESIKDYAFSGCSKLEAVNIPDETTSIGEGAFSGCSKLSEITIPDKVSKIEKGIFRECSNLATIKISNEAISIGDEAFNGCSKLSEITIPDKVSDIGDLAFGQCSGLVKITIPKSVVKIGSSAFSDCTSLESITIPDSVKEISFSAFSGCTNIIEKENGVSYVGKWVVECSDVSDVILRSDTIGIAHGAFINCTKIQNLTIPNSVTNIGNSFWRIIYLDDIKSITFKGTKAEWIAVANEVDWKEGTDSNTCNVVCTDGTLSRISEEDI